MDIDLTLGGALTRLLPEGHKGNRLQLQCDPDASLAAVMSQLGIDDDSRLLVILNGSVVVAENYHSTHLADGDQLSLMPPIQAG